MVSASSAFTPAGLKPNFVNDIAAFDGEHDSGAASGERNSVVVEVGGKRVEVSLPSNLFAGVTAERSSSCCGSSLKAQSRRRSWCRWQRQRCKSSYAVHGG
jgi:acetyl-CoA/propionyl-CoA carboxylase biotin carboxyl carrier protein